MTFNWHKRGLEERTLGDRVADSVASFVGSWPFVFLHVLWFAVWIGFRVELFPYGFLTMVVSLEAIFLTTLVMMSQNREADRDRIQASADYETNVKAKEEIEELQQHLARIEIDKLDKIISIIERA
jgi:uncharacterized membrane protein